MCVSVWWMRSWFVNDQVSKCEHVSRWTKFDLVMDCKSNIFYFAGCQLWLYMYGMFLLQKEQKQRLVIHIYNLHHVRCFIIINRKFYQIHSIHLYDHYKIYAILGFITRVLSNFLSNSAVTIKFLKGSIDCSSIWTIWI